MSYMEQIVEQIMEIDMNDQAGGTNPPIIADAGRADNATNAMAAPRAPANTGKIMSSKADTNHNELKNKLLKPQNEPQNDIQDEPKNEPQPGPQNEIQNEPPNEGDNGPQNDEDEGWYLNENNELCYERLRNIFLRGEEQRAANFNSLCDIVLDEFMANNAEFEEVIQHTMYQAYLACLKTTNGDYRSPFQDEYAQKLETHYNFKLPLFLFKL